jgi:hypothetical protein
MTAPESGTPVTLGGRTYYVRIVDESVRRTLYYVSCPSGAARSWKPAEVRVGAESRFVCLGCKGHPGVECIHVAIVKKAAALEPMPAIETTRDRMLRELGGTAPQPAHGAEVDR